MALAGLESTAGTATYISAAEPAGYSAAELAALTWEKVVGVVSFGEWGDSENDVTQPLLEEERVIHTNGVSDGGEVPISVQYRTTDAGSDIILANSGDNVTVTVLKVYKSGMGEVASGVLTSPRYVEASGDSVRGYRTSLRVNTAVTELSASDVTTALA